eukprot:29026-Pelagococcus_subviridis.AAC.6
MPSIVSDASAMFVATMTFLLPGGAGSKMRVCISDGSDEYTGRMCRSGTDGPRPFMRSNRTWHDVSISSWPVRNKRTSPSGSVRCICITVMSAASM